MESSESSYIQAYLLPSDLVQYVEELDVVCLKLFVNNHLLDNLTIEQKPKIYFLAQRRLWREITSCLRMMRKTLD